MATKNAKSAHFWQKNNKIQNICQTKGLIILPSSKAWQKYNWARKYFEKKPKQGYFIWLKKPINTSLFTCITITSPKISQNLKNLLIIEKNIKAQAKGICSAQKNNLSGKHKAKGKIILKKDAILEYEHFHNWGPKDFVNPDYEFVLKENSQLNYVYKNLSAPRELKIKTLIRAYKNSSANIELVIDGKNSKMEIHDTLSLKQKNARGSIKLRLVARKNSQINALSKIMAEKESQGHLDCQGLIVDKKSEVRLVPELFNKNENALITHEASIGKISEQELTYLRMRGLTQKQAIDLIVNGFLKS